MPTTGRILELAPVSCLLAANKTAKGSLFGPPVDPKLPITIYMVNKILKRIYDLDPTYDGVYVVGIYLYELIARYANRAAAIVDNNTGGQVAPPSGITIPNAYDFIVSDSSFIATGESSITITEFIGYPVNFSRGEMMQHTTPTEDGFTTYYSWNIVTGLFTISSPATAGERFRIMPDVYGQGGTTTIVDDTTFPFVVTSADFEPDGVTLNDIRLIGNQYYLDVAGYNQEHQYAGVFFDYTATGLVVIASGFDAANFGNILITKLN